MIKISRGELESILAERDDWKQRAKAAEAKLAGLDKEPRWRELALQFDGHRMEAISLLKMIVNDTPPDSYSSVRNFLNSAPLSGEEVLRERLLAIANRPAHAVSLAELVPTEIDGSQSSSRYPSGWNDCRAAILRNIEEVSK